MYPKFRLTDDGHEYVWQTNYLGQTEYDYVSLSTNYALVVSLVQAQMEI